VADTFTNSFHPAVGKASVAVLEDAGFTVEVPARLKTAVLADRFSCRTQIWAGQLGRNGMHLAELLTELLEIPCLTSAVTGSGPGAGV
jgi:hypothetical protein